jgi:hypothetical protein
LKALPTIVATTRAEAVHLEHTRDMVALIHRRHEGPGWQVFTELANGTGSKARRRADAVAMGMWPSRGYEIHGYECKISRGDARKELLDVSKMDAVGRYCDFWWMVVRDPEIIDGLLIPEAWGILAPRARVLRQVRPAKKRKADPVDRAFVAAMVRSVTDGWVPRSQHQEVLEGHRAEVAKAIEDDRRYGGHDAARRDLQLLLDRVKVFETASGVSLDGGWGKAGNIGVAVRAVVDALEYGNTWTMKGHAKVLRELAETAASHAKALQSFLDLQPKEPD